MNKNMNRRTFFQSAAALVGAAVILPVISKAEGRRGGGKAAAAGPALVDVNSPEAKAVKYAHNHADVKDKSVMIDRQGVKFKDQLCSGCGLYDKSKETTINGKKAAPCPAVAGKFVAADGFCTTWNKRA